MTGSIEGYTREGAEEAILARGGKSPGSVSARTWAVVLGAEPGAAKLKKAEELGIPIVQADQFEALLETGRAPRVLTSRGSRRPRPVVPSTGGAGGRR